MPKATEGGPNGGSETPRVQWGDLAIAVAVSGVVVALMLTPTARRFWLPDSVQNNH